MKDEKRQSILKPKFTKDKLRLKNFQLESRKIWKSDLMSDWEDTNIMLKNYGTNDFENNSQSRDIDVELQSNGFYQSANSVSDDFRSLLNTNSAESIEITVEIVEFFVCENTNQVTKKLGNLKTNSNALILEANKSTITSLYAKDPWKVGEEVQCESGPKNHLNFPEVIVEFREAVLP